MSKHTRALVRDLVRQGFQIRITRRGHYQVSKNHRVIAVLPGTPSDRRSMSNSLADLRRGGFVGSLSS